MIIGAKLCLGVSGDITGVWAGGAASGSAGPGPANTPVTPVWTGNMAQAGTAKSLTTKHIGSVGDDSRDVGVVL